MAGSCEHSNDTSASTEGGIFLAERTLSFSGAALIHCVD